MVVDVAVVWLEEIVTVSVTVEEDEDLASVVELGVLMVEVVEVVVLLVVEDALCDVELDVVVDVVVEVSVVVTAVTVMLANPWLEACVSSPMYCPLIAYVPAEVGVRTMEQVPDSSRVQPESMFAPSEDGPLRRTKAVGMEDGVKVSSTVTVHVVDEPTVTSDDEQTMAVVVGSCTTRETLPELEA